MRCVPANSQDLFAQFWRVIIGWRMHVLILYCTRVEQPQPCDLTSSTATQHTSTNVTSPIFINVDGE